MNKQINNTKHIENIVIQLNLELKKLSETNQSLNNKIDKLKQQNDELLKEIDCILMEYNDIKKQLIKATT